MRELRPVAPKWQVFSVQLGVPASEVDVIAAKPLLLSGAPLTFLQDALKYWISESHPACTLNTLCDVLKSDLVNESALAVHLEAHFWEQRAKGNCISILMYNNIYYISYNRSEELVNGLHPASASYME